MKEPWTQSYLFIDMYNDFPEITSMIHFDSEVLYLFVDFIRHLVNSAAIYDKYHTVHFVTKIRVFNVSRKVRSERNHGVELQKQP